MAIFSRRTIQRLISENAKFISKKQTREHLKKLNSNDKKHIEAEWEVALLNSFSKLGTVHYEYRFKGNSRPDVYFISSGDQRQQFLADIITVSDEGLDKQNPIKALNNVMLAKIHEHNDSLRVNSFSLEVESYEEEAKPSSKTKLKIPGDFLKYPKKLFNQDFENFLNKVTKAPDKERAYRIKDTGISIAYNPKQIYAITTFPNYNQITSLTQNNIYKNLVEKFEQLKKTGYKGHRGIILCDGECSLLSSKSDWAVRDVNRIIRKFLHDYQEISFVLSITVEQHFGYDARCDIIHKLYNGKSFDDLSSDLQNVLDTVSRRLPDPVQDAGNAVRALKSYQIIPSYKDLVMRSGELKISARILLDLLAGRLKQEDFLKIYQLTKNPFETELKKGNLITEIIFEKSNDEKDDDYVILRFSGPDPAISPFVMPDPYPHQSKK